MRKIQGVIPHYTLKELSIATDIRLCWINFVWMKEFGTDITQNNQLVRASEIGPCQPNRMLCIHVAVNNMIIIKGQSHNYLILTN